MCRDGSVDDDGYGGDESRCWLKMMLEKGRETILERKIKNFIFQIIFYFLIKGNFRKKNELI